MKPLNIAEPNKFLVRKIFTHHLNNLFNVKLQSYAYLKEVELLVSSTNVRFAISELIGEYARQIIDLTELFKTINEKPQLTKSWSAKKKLMYNYITNLKASKTVIEFDTEIIYSMLLSESIEIASITLLKPIAKTLHYDFQLLREIGDLATENRTLLESIFKEQLNIAA